MYINMAQVVVDDKKVTNNDNNNHYCTIRNNVKLECRLISI